MTKQKNEIKICIMFTPLKECEGLSYYDLLLQTNGLNLKK